MLFTWSAYVVIGVGTMFLRSFCHSESKTKNLLFGRSLPAQAGFTLFRMTEKAFRMTFKKIFFATGGGVVASIWFYLWTNFGVWFLDSFGMYPKTFNGLVTCYINGIPFFKNQLFSNLIIIPLVFGMIEFGLWFVKYYSRINKEYFSSRLAFKN
jgi:hypothetical protein